ncbi:MAG: ABC transporter permease, partial [Oscillospiraceae bacterium]|nr:ABC transporter permease [Oscillospiraceae bacterium]
MIKSRYPAFPYIAFMAIFIVVPLIMVAYFAFTTGSGEFTLQNIIRVGDYIPVIIKSLFLAFVATVICLLLGYPFAYIMAGKTSNIRSTMFMLIMLPMWMNFLLRTYSWMTILEKNGLLNRFLGIFGIGPFEMINTQVAVVL